MAPSHYSAKKTNFMPKHKAVPPFPKEKFSPKNFLSQPECVTFFGIWVKQPII